MGKLVRFSISIEGDLIDSFDDLIKENKYSNRSFAFRELIRKELANTSFKKNINCSAVLILKYDHHKCDLLGKLTEIEHNYENLIIAKQHIHIDHNNCMETIAMRGLSQKVLEFSKKIKSLKGISMSELTFV